MIITMISCKTDQNDFRNRLVPDYIQGLNTGDFNLISKCISDSVVNTEMDYVLSKNKQELYRQFQWDSVFSSSYNLIDF